MTSVGLAQSGRQVSGVAMMWVIARREWTRFLRQPSRIVAAIGTPLILWVFMGAGFARSFSPPTTTVGADASDLAYAAYLLPGMITLVAMFTAIFSSISIIEDRREGWLRSVMVSPVPRWAIAGGKILGGAAIAFLQAGILLVFLPLLNLWPGFGWLLLVLAMLAVTSLAMTGIGVAFAWRSESVQGFHAVMNLVLMPMWLLSGAFFPPEGSNVVLRWVMYANPLTWCSRAIQRALCGEADVMAIGIASGFTVAVACMATWIIARPIQGGDA